jgi:hypothetical protein
LIICGKTHEVIWDICFQKTWEMAIGDSSKNLMRKVSELNCLTLGLNTKDINFLGIVKHVPLIERMREK